MNNHSYQQRLRHYQATTGGEAALVDHSAEIKPDLKTSIQSAMTDLERDMSPQQGGSRRGSDGAGATEAAENGTALQAESAPAADAVAADATVSDTWRQIRARVYPR